MYDWTVLMGWLLDGAIVRLILGTASGIASDERVIIDSRLGLLSKLT